MTPLYTATAEITGGRDGAARLADRPEPIALRTPRAMGGTGDGLNPEQLFAIAFGACFGAALDLEARQAGLAPPPSAVTATVALAHGDHGHFTLSIRLTIRLPGVERATAERLIAAADRACPYARMTRGDVQVELLLDEAR